MTDRAQTRRPGRRRLRLLTSLPVALLVLLPTAAHAAVPVAPVRMPSGIEGFATYQPQTTCSPTAKPGAVKLKNLLLKTYPGTRSLGISRACSAGGTSEHKEGRAFDWGVRYANTAERAKANAFLTWLLKTDSRGHKAANARRLGVMYVIWNHRIWGAYAANQGWRPYHGSNPHTDHVHISLTRAGGAGRVSFWTGHVNGVGTTVSTGTTDSAGNVHPPAGVPAPTPIVPAPVPPASLPTGSELEDETVSVRPTTSGTYTRAALVRGETYRVEVRGTWAWNRTAGALADGECSVTADSGWWRDRGLANAAGDQLGLYLDGHDLSLRTYDGGTGCATASHTYATTLTPTRTGRVPLRLWEPAPAAAYADNTGAVTVRIIHDAQRDVLPVQVDTHERWGTTTPGSLKAGDTYTVTVTGTWQFEGETADAVCTDSDNGPVVLRDDSGRRVWRLTLDGQSLRASCSPDQRYEWTVTAQHDGPAVMRIETDSYDASSGTLSALITRV